VTTHTKWGTRDVASYTTDDGIDRGALAKRNHELLLARRVPVSVIVEQLGKVLDVCPECGGEKPSARRQTCSRQCANAIAGRGGLGQPKPPQTEEHRQKISVSNKRYAAEVAARKIPRAG
jgi:hypothetical protein